MAFWKKVGDGIRGVPEKAVSGVDRVWEKLVRCNRGTHLWGRRWLRTSKPTEWMSSTASLLTVFSAICAALFLVFNGFFDQKKSELEAKRSELTIQIVKAEMDRERLAEAKGYLETKVSDANIALKMKENELKELNKEMEASKLALSVANARLDEQTVEMNKWEHVRKVIARYSDAGSRTRLHTFKRDPLEEHPRNIYGLEITCNRRETGQDKDVEEILQMARSLRITVMCIDGVDLSRVAWWLLVGFDSIHELHLQDCNLNDENMANIKIPKSVQKISIANNRVKNMAWMPNPESLVGLNVSGTKVSEEEFLSVIEKAPGLADIRFAGLAFSDMVLKEVAKKCPKIMRLDCHATDASAAGVRDYVKASPDLQLLICSKKQIDEEMLKKKEYKFGDDLKAILVDDKYNQRWSYMSVDISKNSGDAVPGYRSSMTLSRWLGQTRN